MRNIVKVKIEKGRKRILKQFPVFSLDLYTFTLFKRPFSQVIKREFYLYLNTNPAEFLLFPAKTAAIAIIDVIQYSFCKYFFASN
jgi:hypothetical protein